MRETKIDHNYLRTSRPNSKSKYKGVVARKNGKFEAQIRVNKKFHYLGYFDTEVEAAQAYNDAVDKYLNGEGWKNEIYQNINGDLRQQKVCAQIYETSDYGLFDFFIENRKIAKNDAHVKRLIKTIEDGYELPPILVNEAGMIIDGQHRFAAWKSLDMPIKYFIGPYQGRKQLGMMNGSGQKHWSVLDHVKSLAVKNDDYKTLLEYYQYSDLGFRELAYLLSGSYMETKSIKAGGFKLDKERQLKADKFLKLYALKFQDVDGKILKFAIFKLWELGKVDVNRLATIARARNNELKKFRNYIDTMNYLVEEYNYNQKKYKFEITYAKNGDRIFSFTGGNK